jgi:DNA-binding MarR family transcriptional regulator
MNIPTAVRKPPRKAVEKAAHREASTRYGSAFKGAMVAVRRLRGRDTHHPGELSYAQFGLLFGLAAGGEMSASELAGCADIAPGTATQMLDSLEAAGLIARTRSELDRRCVLVSLTTRGGEVIATRRADYQMHWDDALSGFTPEELDIAAAVLERTRAMFDEFARSAPITQPAQAPTPAA